MWINKWLRPLPVRNQEYSKIDTVTQQNHNILRAFKVPEITQRQLRQRNVNVMYSLTLYQIKAILETREPQPRYKMQSIRYRTSEAKVYTIW